jgi:hypothetical protein
MRPQIQPGYICNVSTWLSSTPFWDHSLVHAIISNNPPLLHPFRFFLDSSQIYARHGLKWLFGLSHLASSKWAKILPLISIVVLSCINQNRSWHWLMIFALWQFSWHVLSSEQRWLTTSQLMITAKHSFKTKISCSTIYGDNSDKNWINHSKCSLTSWSILLFYPP